MKRAGQVHKYDWLTFLYTKNGKNDVIATNIKSLSGLIVA